jgi:hypothetical protein
LHVPSFTRWPSGLPPDGSWKHRLIWDLLRSEVNSPPRAGGLLSFGTDVADAFHQVPLHPLEGRYTVAVFESRFYYFTVLVFGSASAPTVWGRFAAFAARAVAAFAILSGSALKST